MQDHPRTPFRVPNTVRIVVPVDQGRIGLTERADTDLVDRAPVPTNGVVEVVEGGLVLFTHSERGDIDVRVQVLPEPADDALLGVYEDVVEVSYRARSGSADVVTPGGAGPAARAVTFPGAGAVRARVHATGRLDARAEQIVIQLWSAPEAPERVLRTAAGVAAARAAGPERSYDWIEESVLGEAACLTFAPGATPEEVLDAFGADPADTVAWSDRVEAFPDLDPFVGVVTVPGGVVAVEDNRWTGIGARILEGVSGPGRRAAAAFWNVNGLSRLAFARDGIVLADAEWGIEAVGPDLDPEVSDAVAGIDFGDVHALTAKKVLAASRFTGLALHAGDLEDLETSGRAYRVIPSLPALHPVPRPPRGGVPWPGERYLGGFYLSELAEEFSHHTAGVLAELARWAAAESLTAVGLADHPAVAPALERLAGHPGTPLDAAAATLVRRSVLHLDADHSTRAWELRRHALTALHEATNPDPLGAAAGAVGYAHETLRATVPDFLERARRHAAHL